MVGIVPSANKTFEVYGDFTTRPLLEGKLYYDPKDLRLYYYSTKVTRSNPNTGFYPVWDGTAKYITEFSRSKYFDRDVIKTDIGSLCAKVTPDVADKVLYDRRKSEDGVILRPVINDDDNMFTQCVKGTICKKNLTMIDLFDASCPPLTEHIIENSYTSLQKIAFMRADKWSIWTDAILHVSYRLMVHQNGKHLVTYYHPEERYDTGIVKYDSIIKTQSDPLKKIARIIMIMLNLDKASLKSPEIDDYTVNNMMTTLLGDKPLSAQLFSRFVRMAKVSYTLTIVDNGVDIFEYRE